MLLRTALSLVNLAALSATLVVWLALPAYSGIALYACLGWVMVAFGVMYSRWGNRPIGRRAGGLTAEGAAPALGGGVGFCVFCAANLAPGATRCPDCGRATGR